MVRVLIIEEDESWKATLSRALSSSYHMCLCSNEIEASRLLDKQAFDVILLEMDMRPGLSDQINLIKRFSLAPPYTPVIVTSRSEKAELIVKAIKAGAADFIAKPYSAEKIRLAIDHGLENKSLKNEIDYLRRQQDVIYDIERIVAASPAMKNVISMLKRLANSDSTILMTGETGTGKSLISGTIHFNSPRKSKPFTKINCANIPETLLESELFGHEKGAFTGASKTRAGRFEQANGGTVFMDEIGELSPVLQAKLLRVMEDKAFERLGTNRTIYSDIRIIAATNRNLEQAVAAGTFREDLYYRINVLRVHLPPLRERRDCIEPLATHLLTRICRSVKKQVDGFTPEVMYLFKRYSWPGNIRELSNTIERAVILEDDHFVHLENVSLPEVSQPQDEHGNTGQGVRDSERSSQHLQDHEKDLILEALKKSLWIQKDAAALLGVTPRALHYKIRKHGITHPRWYKNN
jgi:DNA-binding NtrC family response regulator